ncbi:MAG: adenosylcobinamide-GDP ribazoletransferase [Sphingomonadales bacterium]|nr:adenosylcobinamide-GDP ribazoletransferase [Sphingomonadales bacterium]
MKEEIKIFFTALMFYTRIPCPKNIDHSPEYINKATRYFPFIGWIVGLISFAVFWISTFLFNMNIAVLFSLIAGVLVTGAFHEDGLADVFDGFGGGWTKAKILEIMKDSRVGAYGVIALIFLFALKYLALHNLFVKIDIKDHLFIALIFIAYHSLSRLTAINIVFTSHYSREDEGSKAKPLAKAHSIKEIFGAYLFGLIPLLVMCIFQWPFCLVILPLFLLFFYSKRYFNKWIDGYTGDCLGAVEQMAECVCLLTFLVLWKFM